MRLIEQIRERHRQAKERREKGALGWWAILQICVLVFNIFRLLRGKK